MIISEKNHCRILNIFLIAIASLMIFRVSCTIVLMVFFGYCCLNFNKIRNNNDYRRLVLLIASPLIINLVFLWNNNSLHEGLKATEKYVGLLFLPMFIIGNYKYILMNDILKKYAVLLSIILIALFVRYIIFFPELFNKYLNGVHLWELGYSFANSFNSHAPALNMHIAFAVVAVFYLMVNALTRPEKSIKEAASCFIIFIVLFFFLLYINTRLALVNAIIGIGIVLVYQLFHNGKKIKLFFIGLGIAGFMAGAIIVFIHENPYMIKKYTTDTFANMDKIGKLDEIDNVRAVAYNSLVMRLSIWKSALELGLKKPVVGYGAGESKNELYAYFKETRQYFLYKSQLPVHNQVLDFFLKFGIFGLFVFGLYLWNIFQIGHALNNPVIIAFFVIFLISNLSDDFLIRFDGIVYSGFWISIFASHFMKEKYGNDLGSSAKITI